MARTFLIGIAAAVFGGIGLWVGGVLGMTFEDTIMGVGGGLIIGVVRLGSPLGRLLGYIIGLVLGTLFAAARLGWLPGGESVAGGAIALAVVLVVIAVVSGVTANRISSWSILLGALVYVAGVSSIITTKPWTALSQLPDQFLSILAMSAMGFIVVVVAEMLPGEAAKPPKGRAGRGSVPPPRSEPTADVTSLDGIIGGAK